MKLQVNISMLKRYKFEMNVPDDYDKNEAYVIAANYFEENEAAHELWYLVGDLQVDFVREVADEPLMPPIDFVNRGE